MEGAEHISEDIGSCVLSHFTILLPKSSVNIFQMGTALPGHSESWLDRAESV
jgi:hypothetical protein